MIAQLSDLQVNKPVYVPQSVLDLQTHFPGRIICNIHPHQLNENEPDNGRIRRGHPSLKGGRLISNALEEFLSSAGEEPIPAAIHFVNRSRPYTMVVILLQTMTWSSENVPRIEFNEVPGGQLSWIWGRSILAIAKLKKHFRTPIIVDPGAEHFVRIVEEEDKH